MSGTATQDDLARAENPTAPKTNIQEDSPKAFKLFKEVTLPIAGGTIRLEKLKSGKYYEAQKLYVAWIKGLQDLLSSKGGLDADKLKQMVNKDGKPDMKKIEEELSKNESSSKIDLSAILGQVTESSSSRLDLLAICLGVERKVIEEEHYPEDIDVLIPAAIELNNFLSNLKKSVAPSVGAQ